MGGVLRVAALLLLLLPACFAEDYVAVNSFDGRDVLSGIFYGNVKGYPVRFMPAPDGSSTVFASKVGSGHSILLIQSTTNPASGFVETELRNNDNQLTVFQSEDGGKTNLELAKRSGAQGFIVVDSAFSESALSVIPYAALTKSYVILADRTNIDEVKEIVRGKKVTIYGYVDKKVREGLAEFSPQTIGKGEDKYEDNVAIVAKTMDEFSLDRPIVTDGTMIEDSLSDGTMPILLCGRLVPTVTYEFIKERVKQGKMTGVLLVGSDLLYPVYDMREKMKREFEAEGISKAFGIMVKFAQAIPSAQTGVLTLDTFRVPAYAPVLSIDEIFYNRQTGKVMVGLENKGEGALYYTLELRVLVDGKEYRTFGGSDAQLVERGESASAEYPLDLSGIPEGAVSATALVKFGGAKKSLEEFATSEGKLATISYTDTSNVSVKFAKYDAAKQSLMVTLKNSGPQTAYAFVKLTLVDEEGAQVKVSGASIRELESGALFVEEFPLIMSEKEISLNKEVPVSVSFGGRRGFLNKEATYVVPLEGEVATEMPMQLSMMAVGALAAVIILALLFAIYKYANRKK